VELDESFGAAIEKPSADGADGWLVLTPETDLDVEHLKTFSVWTEPPPTSIEDRKREHWALLEGAELKCHLKGRRQMIDRADGIGSPLRLALGPYNHHDQHDMCRAVISSGEIGRLEVDENAFRLYLRHELELSGDHSVYAWYAGSEAPLLVEEDAVTALEPKVIQVGHSGKNLLGAALAYRGKWYGARTAERGWGGFNELIASTPDWERMAHWLAWWRLPILHPWLRAAASDAVRDHAVDTFLAWLKPNPPGARIDSGHRDRWNSAMIELFEDVATSAEDSRVLLACLHGQRLRDACGASPRFVATAMRAHSEPEFERWQEAVIGPEKNLESLLKLATEKLGREIASEFVKKSLLPDFRGLLNGSGPGRFRNLNVAIASTADIGRYLMAAVLQEWINEGVTPWAKRLSFS
jgi:hypothetical protein